MKKIFLLLTVALSLSAYAEIGIKCICEDHDPIPGTGCVTDVEANLWLMDHLGHEGITCRTCTLSN